MDHAIHPHAHDPASLNVGRLTAAAALNSGFAVVQVIVGISLGAVVVLADALHQVVDSIGLLTALGAALLAARPTSETMSYGWGKSDALGGLVSGLLLLGSLAWIFYESIQRILDPVAVSGRGVITIGIIAVAINGLSVIALSGTGELSLALRAAKLHLLIDLAGSFLVIAAGVILVGTSWTWIDPVASLVLSIVVLRATYALLFASTRELLDRAPDGISVAAVQALLDEQPGVDRVHHVHVRPLGQGRTSVTAHVVITETSTLHDAQHHLAALGAVLEHDLDVSHTTLQLECHPCDDHAC